MSEINLFFIRHWENLKSWKDNFSQELSSEWISEIVEIAKNLNINRDYNINFVVNNIRSFLTATLIEWNNISNYDELKNELAQWHMRVLNILNYLDIHANSNFLINLQNAEKNWNILEYLVKKSDEDVSLSERGNVSSYDKIVRDLASYLLRYKTIQHRWNNISNKSQPNNKILTRTFYPRAYIYWCLRAKITELLQGREQMAHYVWWFDKTIINDNKKFLWSISVTKNNDSVEFYLKDPFGSLSFSIKDLYIILDEEDKHRKWAYILPIDSKKKKICVLKYPDWYWTIWWWVKKWESFAHALKREITEETNLLSFLNANELEKYWIDTPYTFEKKTSNGDILDETHKYHILPIDINENLYSMVDWVSIERIPIEVFLWGDFSNHDQYNRYIKESIQPVIKKFI